MNDGGTVLLFFVLFWGIAALLPASIARDKGRSFAGWYVYGLLLFLIALIHSLLLKPIGEAADAKRLAGGEVKCPSCAEFIKSEARVCRYCGRDVEVPQPA